MGLCLYVDLYIIQDMTDTLCVWSLDNLWI